MESTSQFPMNNFIFNSFTTGILAILIILVFQNCKKKQDSDQIFELPITYHDGNGPFFPGFGILDPEQANGKGNLEKAYQNVTGIPKKWSSVKKAHAESDFSQYVFQNFKAGNVSRGYMVSLLSNPGSVVDTSKLSTKPIKCVVNVIWGADEYGRWAVMIDTDNDLDFSDETPFEPEILDFEKESSWTVNTKQRMVTFEAFQSGRVVSYQVPMVVKQSANGFIYNFPRYASASLIKDNKEYKIFISSSRPSFDNAGISYLGDDSTKILTSNQLIRPGKNLELGDLIHKSKYKNLGVDWYNQTLKLQGVPSDKVEYILQEGYQFQDFEGKEFATGKRISTKNLRGKYVYIDFWWTGCKGCVEDMPKINELYRKIDKTKFAMIGIADEDAKRLMKAIEKYNIKWPQLSSGENGNLIKKYKVSGYPTSVLLDKTGKIIAMNLRSPELEKTIGKLK